MDPATKVLETVPESRLELNTGLLCYHIPMLSIDAVPLPELLGRVAVLQRFESTNTMKHFIVSDSTPILTCRWLVFILQGCPSVLNKLITFLHIVHEIPYNLHTEQKLKIS